MAIWEEYNGGKEPDSRIGDIHKSSERAVPEPDDKPCPECKGFGVNPETGVMCDKCEGTGVVL